jgi:hypothetical protein
MYVGDGASSPVIFADSGSGLAYTFGGLGSSGDDIAFTNEAGPSPVYAYTPAGGLEGYDSAVTGFQIYPKGAFVPGSSFDLEFIRMRMR